jgi:hypothetical protein
MKKLGLWLICMILLVMMGYVNTRNAGGYVDIDFFRYDK